MAIATPSIAIPICILIILINQNNRIISNVSKKKVHPLQTPLVVLDPIPFSKCVPPKPKNNLSFAIPNENKPIPIKPIRHKCQSRNVAYESSSNMEVRRASTNNPTIGKPSQNSTAVTTNVCSKKQANNRSSSCLKGTAGLIPIHKDDSIQLIDIMSKLKINKMPAPPKRPSSRQKSQRSRNAESSMGFIKTGENMHRRVIVNDAIMKLINKRTVKLIKNIGPEAKIQPNSSMIHKTTKYTTAKVQHKETPPKNNSGGSDSSDCLTVIEKECDNDYSLICNSLNFA